MASVLGYNRAGGSLPSACRVESEKMPIPVNTISDKQVQEVLSYTEGHFLDLKAKEIKPSKLTKAISAFANADGGELIIPVFYGEGPGVGRSDWPPRQSPRKSLPATARACGPPISAAATTCRVRPSPDP